ncbi:kinase-like domain-containing protein [Tanacetum coccineum]
MSRLVPSPSFALINILISLFFFITTIAAAVTNISDFPNCLPIDCNGLTISYPFWKMENEPSTTAQYCGYEGLGINCSTIDGQDRPMMYFGGDSYYVRKLTNTSITLVDYDVSSVSPVQTICPRVNHGIELYFDWGQTCDDKVVTTVLDIFGSPDPRQLEMELAGALRTGFELNWRITTDECDKCEESDGLCGYNNSTGFM